MTPKKPAFMLKRHFSGRIRLDQAVLNQRLEGAVAYDRSVGYFRSSLFEVAGEALKSKKMRNSGNIIPVY